MFNYEHHIVCLNMRALAVETIAPIKKTYIIARFCSIMRTFVLSTVAITANKTDMLHGVSIARDHGCFVCLSCTADVCVFKCECVLCRWGVVFSFSVIFNTISQVFKHKFYECVQHLYHMHFYSGYELWYGLKHDIRKICIKYSHKYTKLLENL